MKLFYGILIIFVLMSPVNAEIKKSDFDGKWYSGSASQLKTEFTSYLKDAALAPFEVKDAIGFICPHAGYAASGPVAAYTFKAIQELAPKTVIIVGFTHRKHFTASAVYSGSGYQTPMGILEIDRELSLDIMSHGAQGIANLNDAFEEENSIEMIIPFLQHVAPKTKAVLIAIGNQSKNSWQSLADALYESLKDRKDYAIIASTDLSHYLPYTHAFKTDRTTARVLDTMNADNIFRTSLENDHALMCGISAVCAVMKTCSRLGAKEFVILNQQNSGDTLGDKSSVVGYLSAALVKSGALPKTDKAAEEKTELLSKDEQSTVLNLVRETITAHLSGKQLPELENPSPILEQDLGLFVTLHKRGALRGCIGNMIGTQPLWKGIREMAVAAATADPRFQKVTLKEMRDIDIEISVLSPLEKISDPNKIVVGTHGVLVRKGYLSGVYLPQVATETGWNREQFMNSLCAQKAGMDMNAWKTGDCDIYIFTATVFGEKD